MSVLRFFTLRLTDPHDYSRSASAGEDLPVSFYHAGKKCKFAHDLAVERKSEKKSLYTDSREEEGAGPKEDDMSNWDEAKLRDVVLSKHGNPRTMTDKVCKYFLDAVENQKYGWFWTCPNGGEKCMYRHSLPPGCVILLFNLLITVLFD